MNKKTKAVIAIVMTIIVVVVAIAVNLSNPDSSLSNLINNNTDNPQYDYVSGATIIPGKYMEKKYNEITNDYRPLYDNMTEKHYNWYFSELPSFPEDFFTIAMLIYDGKITDYSRLGEQYWKQPEFYPAWFDVYHRYPDFDYSRFTPHGYGCYPTIKEIETTGKGETITVNTYFRTGFDVNRYQGLVIKPVIPEKAYSLTGTVLFEQPSNADEYLSCSIKNEDDSLYNSFKDSLPYTNVDDEDWMIVLEPTHTILKDKYGVKTGETGFKEDWVRLLQIEIEIDENIPSGDYVVAIKIDPPCFSINQEYYYSLDHEYYGTMYFPGGGVLKTGRPHFQVILRIT